jgi:hypothetical protein
MAAAVDDFDGVPELVHAFDGPQSPMQAIIEAAYSGRTQNMERRIEAALAAGQLDLEYVDDGGFQRTSLMLASEGGHEDVVRVLARYGANLNARDKEQSTALILAAYHGRTGVVDFLIGAGADAHALNKDGENALMVAAWSAKLPSCYSLILKAGVDLEVKSSLGHTAVGQFGKYVRGMTVDVKALFVPKLRQAFADGPNPSQVKRRRDVRWGRRRALCLVLAGCGFQPTAARRAELDSSALPQDVAIPDEPTETEEERRALRRSKVFGNFFICKLILEFL